MTDPFSVISGACGVISLGITICNGIINYSLTVKGADAEVKHITRKAARMQKTMCLLERTLQDNKSLLEREYTDPLKHMVDIIRAGIDNLQDAVNKCWGEAAKSAELVVAGSTAKKALYPFRQKSLLSLNTALDSLHLELSTAMHMAQMQITMASNSAILAQGLATQVMIEQAFTGLKSGQLASICHCRGSSFPTDLKQHTPSCRYRQSVYKSRAMRRRFSFISTFFGFNVSALFDFSMGAHDLKIAPSLTLRAVVPFHAPAFALIDKLRRINWNSKEEVVLDLADTTIVQLRQLYAEGKASPSDINPFGFSILHGLCGLYWKFLCFPDAIPKYIRLIAMCLDSKVLPEPENQYGLTPLHVFLGLASHGPNLDFLWMAGLIKHSHGPDQLYQGILRQLAPDDVGTSFSEEDIVDHKDKKYLVDPMGQSLYTSEISWAILYESKPALEFAIASNPDSIYASIGRHKPIYLAASWPDGLEILLKEGEYNALDLDFALERAVKHDNPFSVQLLLNTGVRFQLSYFNQTSNAEIHNTLITELVKRRANLRDPAVKFLPMDELAQLGVSKELLPDANSQSICEALEERGIIIPDKLKVDIYDTDCSVLEEVSSLKTIKTLHQAGFRSMCRLIPDGFIDPADAIERALWLIDMGLDLKFSKVGLPSVMELWSIVVIYLPFVATRTLPVISGHPPTCKRAYQHVSNKFLKALNIREQQFLQKSLTSDEVDCCTCACSPGNGCYAITITLNWLFKIESPYIDIAVLRGDHTCFRNHLLDYLFKDQSDCFVFVRAVIRFLTFNELGLSHTCHRSHTSWLWSEEILSEKEIAEINDEERIGLQELDDLVSEFEQSTRNFRFHYLISFMSTGHIA